MNLSSAGQDCREIFKRLTELEKQPISPPVHNERRSEMMARNLRRNTVKHPFHQPPKEIDEELDGCLKFMQQRSICNVNRKRGNRAK